MNPRKLIIHATPISKNRNQQKDFKYIYRECTRHEIVLTQIPWNQWLPTERVEIDQLTSANSFKKKLENLKNCI